MLQYTKMTSAKMKSSALHVPTSFAFLVTFVLLTSLQGTRGTQEPLRLLDNGYDGLLVTISDQVPQEHCNQIIHGIKNMLSEFSSALWKATSYRASLRSATVSLPRNWHTNTLTCSLLHPISPTAPTLQSHITVTREHPVFGSQPWTQQSRGCGQPGNYIHMGDELLRRNQNESHVQAAHLLLREWAKFRWGIFEEKGHEGDEVFPSSYRDPKSGNTFRSNKCSEERRLLPFCNKRDHVPEAPTKHNVQCAGRSAWEVIQHNQDFRNGRNPPRNLTSPLSPMIKFVQESAPRYVIVVEDTAVMNLQRRWEFVRKAVRRAVVNDVPDGVHMAVVVFNSKARTVAPLSRMESVSDVRQRVGSSLPRNPSSVPERQKCILCGLQEALKSLKVDPVGAAGANVILVTTGEGAGTSHQMEEIVRLIKTEGVHVIPILYPLTERPWPSTSVSSHGLEPLVNAAGGHAFTIMDEGVGNDSKVSMMVALMDALLAALQMWSSNFVAEGSEGTPVLVHSAAYPGSIASISSGSFEIDDSLAPNVRFSIYYYDLNHVGNTIQLTAPSGTVMASVNMQEEDGDANVIFVNIPNAERGLWTYEVENRADSHQGLHIQVTAPPSTTRNIQVRLWTSDKRGMRSLNASNPAGAVILYAEVTEGELPVLNARVVAKLQLLGTNISGNSYSPIYVDLYDNGHGDPDITGDDGVYSRYLPRLHTFPGRYELSVTVDDNNRLAKLPGQEITTISHHSRKINSNESQKKSCCGSAIRYDHTRLVAPFRREITYGIVNVIDAAPNRDTFPPARILDLRALINDTTRTMTLTWTAVGDDYDWGRADHYEGVMADSWSEAKALAGERLPNLPAPLGVGNEQKVILFPEKYEQLLYVTLRALDKAGNRGGLGNIVSVWIPRPPTTFVEMTTRRHDDFIDEDAAPEPATSGISQPVRIAGLALEDMAVILGSVGGFLIIVTVLATYCYCSVSRRRKQQQKKESDKAESNRNVMIKTNSSLMIDQDESQDSVDSTVKDNEVIQEVRPMSPVQSWAASKLLQEHERRFSVTSGPISAEHLQYQAATGLQEPFPDVTLTGTHSYPSSQTPSTTHSDPPAYQPPYTTAGNDLPGYAPYPYPTYHPAYNHEELPPYTPGMSSQSSQASTAYTHDLSSQPSEMSYPHDAVYPADVTPYSGDMAAYALTTTPPVMYMSLPDENARGHVTPVITTTATITSAGAPGPQRSKVPPPVAPKPQISARAVAVSGVNTTASTLSEPKRRNVTQV
ncbi:LOW QUALITY PROTEIN: calcium-activated chloride channel regulator 4-like [Oratosquilla oratoria]|uniref:LOW QUALITY PROTEIN: calcium-activated chloride channel regulator 4-like n=1 Tax=Oratosquilla oratoria TaxID=337810 RepID=UPI003F766C98